MTEPPTGTVTMLFTDVEGSTALVHALGEDYGAVLQQHRSLLRRALADSGGYEVDCRADELFAVFQSAKDGVTAALAAQRLLAAHAWPEGSPVRVRMGLHTGEPGVEGGIYLGLDVHRAARIGAAGHGGQILLSQTTRDLVADGFEVRDLGSYSLAGLPVAERIFQLAAAGLRSEFPALRVESSERRLNPSGLPRRRPRRPTLADAAWHVRQLLPGVAASLQTPLAELGGALFTADRALTRANEFLERVDHKQLSRRLVAQRKAGVTLQRAREEADKLQARIDCVDQLEDRRHALASLAPQLPDKLDALRTEQEITRLHERVATAADHLDQALTSAARALDPLSFKLARTRWRGIYRSGPRRYIVRYTDEQGRDRHREFESSKEARSFRLSVQTARQAKKRSDLANRASWDAGESLPYTSDEPFGKHGRPR
jgi:class 3 adenylate cyclase